MVRTESSSVLSCVASGFVGIFGAQPPQTVLNSIARHSFFKRFRPRMDNSFDFFTFLRPERRSKSPPTFRSLKVHQGNPFAARAGEESSSMQRLDGAQRPPAACQRSSKRRRWMMEAWRILEAVAEDGSGGGGG